MFSSFCDLLGQDLHFKFVSCMLGLPTTCSMLQSRIPHIWPFGHQNSCSQPSKQCPSSLGLSINGTLLLGWWVPLFIDKHKPVWSQNFSQPSNMGNPSYFFKKPPANLIQLARATCFFSSLFLTHTDTDTHW